MERHSNESSRGPACWCPTRVIYFFAALLAFTLGLILGALNVIVILAALPAVVTFAVVMLVLIVALLIYKFCACCPKPKKCE